MDLQPIILSFVIVISHFYEIILGILLYLGGNNKSNLKFTLKEDLKKNTYKY